jgi:tRNA(fMet)-specific endonuclease VapC
MVCLDTDILVGLLRNDPDAKKFMEENTAEQNRTTAISSYELLKGAAISSRPGENLSLVGQLLSSLPILPLDQDSSELASRVYSEAKLRHRSIGEFDILIASIAMNNDEVLVTRDKHFEDVENLSVRSW